ncbi:hypothetical protein AC1031_000467 [Aphanomyces cochlioides]|nr:hypothetical protein AC1031_000467 [Aphanomyces cochlioides]
MSKEDLALLASLDAAAKYSREAQQASDVLRGAFFKLSAAKRSVSTDVLSSASFRDLFDATSGVDVDASGFSLRKDWNLEDIALEHEKRGPEETSSVLRNRKKTPETSSDAPLPNASKSLLPTPIFWFAPMPSQDLRSAQKLFTQALEQYIQVATAAQSVQKSIRDVEQVVDPK